MDYIKGNKVSLADYQYYTQNFQDALSDKALQLKNSTL